MNNKNTCILFIGNSHTYMNDLPALVKTNAEENNYSCDITMIAHGGWYLANHVKEKEVRFNVVHGGYDYVVLQEHSHPFDHIEEYRKAVKTIAAWAKEVGSTIVIYGTWARKDDGAAQDYMNKIHREVASENDALLAPVGESWWSYMKDHPGQELYQDDGAHASLDGSGYAAKIIWET